MESHLVFIVSSTLLLLFSSSAFAQTASPPSASPTLTPTPAPAPAPEYVNLTYLLSVAGPFNTFLKYAQSTKVIETLQNQANNTDQGVTIFVPKDDAFKSLKKPSLSNLTNDQLKSLLLFHALPQYYSLAEFTNLTANSQTTMAGGQYTLNFTDKSGTVHVETGWATTKVSSSVHSTDPVAIYQVDKVLLPEAIFGTDIPPTAAPAPSPDLAPAADAPKTADTEAKSPASSSPGNSSSNKIISLGFGNSFVLAISGGLALLFL
ncbi:fasciclin-like arabinogalactan protein 7 [Ziziphus jujuba]|uniref:Fasciclin-like arabinogalactan protein 7 n=2 Tax=Ziziphus jujuba TaxID=326968 RepID=A0A6P6FV98_ZIZJJ|nr:fasciclin-like arabinogalactan protein 7 [Ziziphus jujuba]XP_048328795.1 fasciclin-like arabinogalactan protein 7 [Ziziphus jujuba var. spinosa]XP_060672852.1 fasciclin-like arabinogalactan protein 7 [Ziziphus jujuba]KAH7533439.1 hypothetical protein FEM48_Zijuj04G0130700 [Ziziphus jujuba var. spinosa]